jgi:hypothetical protein
MPDRKAKFPTETLTLTVSDERYNAYEVRNQDGELVLRSTASSNYAPPLRIAKEIVNHYNGLMTARGAVSDLSDAIRRLETENETLRRMLERRTPNV